MLEEDHGDHSWPPSREVHRDDKDAGDSSGARRSLPSCGRLGTHLSFLSVVFLTTFSYSLSPYLSPSSPPPPPQSVSDWFSATAMVYPTIITKKCDSQRE